MKTALVTGSSRGIGRGIALALAAAGYDVGVHCAATAAAATEVAAKIQVLGRIAHTYQANIRTTDEIVRLFQEFLRDFGHIDLLVNNAGVTRMAPFLELDEAMYQEVMETDLKGTFFCAQLAARDMVARGVGGVIVNISSNHSLGSWPRSTAYAAAKAGVDKLTKNMALELAPHGIRVVCIAPGYTATKASTPEREAERRRIYERIPMQRFTTPTEVGSLVAYVASDAAGYMTGTTVFLDGGALLPVLPENDFI
jgi:NAD(P)-dependent dehydrogenase (short-subunit alcohol dehydrogenase family)